MPPVIALALTYVGATAAAAFVESAIGAAIVNIGLAVGLSLAGNLLLRGQSPTIKPSDGQQTIKQSLPDRLRSYGVVRLSGAIFWMEATTATPSTLYLGIALNHGEIAAFVSYHIDENEVDLDGSGNVTTVPYSTYVTKLLTRRGVTPETKYSEILSTFGVDNVRGDGIASILAVLPNPSDVTAHTKTYPNGRPLIRATIRSSKVWDPRVSTQSRTDSTTWAFSANPVLCLLHYMLSSDGYGLPWARFSSNIAEWVAAANICDEMVPLANGNNSARYAVGGTYSLDDDPKDVVTRFMSVCDGRVWQRRDGSVGISVGKFQTPTVTLTNKEIVGYAGLTFGQDPVSSIAGIRGQFTSPDNDYRAHEAEPWPDSATVLGLSTTRTAALDLLWVQSNSQARRLMKRAFIRATADWRGTITTTLAGLKAIDERFINQVIPELGINRSFEIDRFTENRQLGTCELEVRSIDASIDNWTIAEEGSEGTGFALVSSFTKTGTTLDVLGEVGAKIGQTVYVFAANNTSVSTPGGWVATGAPLTPGTPSCGVWRRVVDGTESAVTFNGAAGGIIAWVFQGMPLPSETNYFADSRNDAAQQHVMPKAQQPYAVMAFGASNSDFTDSGWLGLVVNVSKVAVAGERFIEYRQGTVTLQARLVIYTFDSVPDDLLMFFGGPHATTDSIVFEAFPGA